MTRKLVTLDRLAGIVVALTLVAVGLLLVDWKLDLLLGLPSVLHVPGLLKTAALGWWPLFTAVLAVVLVLVGLRWLFAHLPRVHSSRAKLGESSAEGRIRLDTGSVANATAAHIESETVLPEVHGRVREVRGHPLVQIDARCAVRTDVAEVRERADQVTADIARAFPSGDIPLRVVVDAPRTRVRDRARRTNARVQ